MEHAHNLAELNFLLSLVNFSSSDHGTSEYNFSKATAQTIIQEYLSTQNTMHSTSTIVLLCLYIPVFVLSLVGNCLVIYVVCKHRHMQRVKNLFLVNLAVADLAVTFICIPITVGQIIFKQWVYGNFLCRITVYLQGVAVVCSIFTLTCLSVDRYLAIKGPPRCMQSWCGRSPTPLKISCILFLTWVFAAVCTSPMFAVRKVFTVDFPSFTFAASYCIEEWPDQIDKETFSILLLVITFIIPVIIIIVCYSLIGKTLCSDEFHRKMSDNSATAMLGRKRVARMLIALIAVFIFCWLPYNVTSLCFDLGYRYMTAEFLPYSLWLGHAHSAVNPVLYYFLNKSFRHCMRRAVSCAPVSTSSERRRRPPQRVCL